MAKHELEDMSNVTVYSPSYQGIHDYKQYDKMRERLKKELKKKPLKLIVDAELLFPEEQNHYFKNLFCPWYIRLGTHKRVWLQAKDRKTIRKIQNILKTFIVVYSSKITMYKGRYVIEIWS